MDASYITIILNVLLFVFILLGFLWGIGRGLKKSSIRLAFFAGAVILAFAFTGLISNLILDIQFNFNGSITTIKNYIINLVVTNPTIESAYNASPSFQELVTKLPVMILNVFVFVLLVLIFKFITWLAYIITVSCLESKKKPLGKSGETVYTVKDGQPVVLEKTVRKKHRLLGGLVSGLQAFIFLFLILIPFNGFVSTINTLSNQTVETISTFSTEEEAPEHTKIATLIHEQVGSEILGYFEAYSKSITVNIMSFGGIDLAFFDSLTTVQVAGENIGFRNELFSLALIYENFSFLIDTDYENWDFETIDFEKIENAIDSLFSSGIFKALAFDFLKYYMNDMIAGSNFGETGFESEILALLGAIENSLDNISDDVNKNELLKQDLLAVVGLAEVFVQSGLYDLLNQPEITENDILDLLQQDNYQLVENILDKLFVSATLREVIAETLNIVFEHAEDELYMLINTEQEISGGTATEVTLDRVSSSTLNFTSLKTDLFNIIKNLGIIYFNARDLNIELPINEMIGEIDSELILTKTGIILNILKSSTILKDTVGGNNILGQILTYLNNSKYGQIANFNSLSSINWESETGILIELYNYVLPLIENEIVFEEFDFEALGDTMDLFFDSNVIKSIKLGVIDLILQNSEPDVNFESLINLIYSHLSNNYNYVYQMKSEILNLLNVFEILGQSGFLDLLKNNNLSDLSTVLEFLKTQNTEYPDTNLNVLIDNLFASDTFKVVFIEFFNNKFLAQIESSSENLGRVDKGLDWANWNGFTQQIKMILSELLNIAENTELYNIQQLNDFEFSLLINANFSETAECLGRILDILATTDFLKYNTGETEYSIYDNLLEKLLGNILTIEFAKTDKYINGFWLNEMQVLSDAISKANLIEIDTEGTSLLEALISGQDLQNLLEDILKSEHFNSMFSVILDSKLLKEQAVDILNMINKGIINLINELYDENAISLDFDISSNKESILDVINAILNANIQSFEDVLDDFEGYKDNVVTLLNALQFDYNDESAFKHAYEIFANFLTDEEGEFDLAPVIAGIIEDQNMSDDIGELDWDEIFNILEDLLES